MSEDKKKNSKWKFIKRIIKMSVSTKYIEALQEWESVKTYDLDKEDYTQEMKDWNTCYYIGKINRCVCSHKHLRWIHLWENNQTQCKCIIGNCCIEKFTDEEKKKEMRAKVKIIKGEEEGNKYCKLCKRKLGDLPSWHTYHKKCFKKIVSMNKKFNKILNAEAELEFDDN
jgi:hypothetical protein